MMPPVISIPRWEMRCPECLRCYAILSVPQDRGVHRREDACEAFNEWDDGQCPECQTVTPLRDMILVEYTIPAY